MKHLTPFSSLVTLALALAAGPLGCADEPDRTDDSASRGTPNDGAADDEGMGELGTEECEAFCQASLGKCLEDTDVDPSVDECVSVCLVGVSAFGPTCADAYGFAADCAETAPCGEMNDVCADEMDGLIACSPGQ